MSPKQGSGPPLDMRNIVEQLVEKFKNSLDKYVQSAPDQMG